MNTSNIRFYKQIGTNWHVYTKTVPVFNAYIPEWKIGEKTEVVKCPRFWTDFKQKDLENFPEGFVEITQSEAEDLYSEHKWR